MGGAQVMLSVPARASHDTVTHIAVFQISPHRKGSDSRRSQRRRWRCNGSPSHSPSTGGRSASFQRYPHLSESHSLMRHAHTLDLGLGQQKSHPHHTICVSLCKPLRTQKGTWQATEHFFHKGVVMTGRLPNISFTKMW